MSNSLPNFNTKVNLSELVRACGLDNFKVVHVKPFGEFAHDPEFKNVFNFIELTRLASGLPNLNPGQCYEWLVSNRQEWLSDRYFYTKRTEWDINAEYSINKEWLKLIKAAKAELHEKVLRFKDAPPSTLCTWLSNKGMAGYKYNDFGYIGKDLQKKFDNIRWEPAQSYKIPIIIPYYYAPGYVSKIEIFDALDIEKRKIFIKSTSGGEGWTGNPNIILPNIQSVEMYNGSVWHPVQRFWINDICEIDPACSTKLCLELFKYANEIKFKMHPLELIREKGAQNEIEGELTSVELNEKEINELSDYFEMTNLRLKWESIRKNQHTHNNNIYYRENTGYSVIRNGIETPLTNFTLAIKERVFYGKTMHFIVEARQKDSAITMTFAWNELKNIKNIREKLEIEFLKAGLKSPKFYSTHAIKHFSNFIFDWFDK